MINSKRLALFFMDTGLPGMGNGNAQIFFLKKKKEKEMTMSL